MAAPNMNQLTEIDWAAPYLAGTGKDDVIQVENRITGKTLDMEFDHIEEAQECALIMNQLYADLVATFEAKNFDTP